MKRSHRSLVAMVAVILIAATTAYALKETPASITGATTVFADTVKKWLDNGEDMVILDPRKESDYRGKGHIPTAINCPVNTDAELTEKVVDETIKHLSSCSELQSVGKGEKIVAYCNGVTCWMSPKAVMALVKMGYTNIFWFRGGMNEWSKKSYPIE